MVTAVTEHGQSVCTVVVRSEAEGRVALGMDGQSLMSHDKYQRVSPHGVTLEWVPFKNTATHQGLKAAIQEHRKQKGGVH